MKVFDGFERLEAEIRSSVSDKKKEVSTKETRLKRMTEEDSGGSVNVAFLLLWNQPYID